MLNIRQMQFDDIEEVVAIERENFSLPWDENGFFSFMIREGTAFLVAEEDGRLAGYCGFVSAADEADITNVSVSKSMRRRGIGKELLNGLLSEAEKEGIKKLFLEVRKSNDAAIALYNKFGFSQISIRKNYYEEPTEDAIVMLKNI